MCPTVHSTCGLLEVLLTCETQNCTFSYTQPLETLLTFQPLGSGVSLPHCSFSSFECMRGRDMGPTWPHTLSPRLLFPGAEGGLTVTASSISHRTWPGADALLHAPDPAAGGDLLSRHDIPSVGLPRPFHPLCECVPGPHGVSLGRVNVFFKSDLGWGVTGFSRVVFLILLTQWFSEHWNKHSDVLFSGVWLFFPCVTLESLCGVFSVDGCLHRGGVPYCVTACFMLCCGTHFGKAYLRAYFHL